MARKLSEADTATRLNQQCRDNGLRLTEPRKTIARIPEGADDHHHDLIDFKSGQVMEFHTDPIVQLQD